MNVTQGRPADQLTATLVTPDVSIPPPWPGPALQAPRLQLQPGDGVEPGEPGHTADQLRI